MRCSVVICAYTLERWGDLVEAVESIRSTGDDAAELILVIDHNAELYAQSLVAFPDAKIVQNELEPGLSGSRNTGVAAATGDLIAFLDDDAVAAPDLLERMRECFRDKAVLGVGANVKPQWLGRRPRWLPEPFLWVVGCTFEGAKPGRTRNVIGAAMCMRREVFDRVGGFARWLGRKGGKLPLSCEETELCMRANALLAPGYFVNEPLASVKHKVRPERTTFSYFLARCWAEGVSKGRLVAAASAGSDLSTERAYTLETLSRGISRGVSETVHGDLGGLLRAGAIVAGFLTTASAFAATAVSSRYASARRFGDAPRFAPHGTGD